MLKVLIGDDDLSVSEESGDDYDDDFAALLTLQLMINKHCNL